MRPGPMPGPMNPPLMQQEGLQLLPRLPKGTGGSSTRSHQIAHRLVGGIGNPDGRQPAGPVQRRQGRGVTAVSLDAIARTPRDQGRCHHDTMAAKIGELPVQAVTARAGLVTQAELVAAPPQTFDQPAHHLGPVLQAPQMPHPALASRRRDRDRDRRLVDIQAHERDILPQARLLCLRPCAGRSGATLDTGHTLRRAVSPQP